MRIIKLGLISFIFLFLLITGFSLFIPSHIRISKAINIRADKNTVMSQIRDVEKWSNWYPGLDSATIIYEQGKATGVTLGEDKKASLLITTITEGEVNATFNTKKLKPVMNVWRIIETPGQDSVILQWYMDFHLRWYPWEKFSSLVLESSYGSKMEQGLTRLKNVLQPL